MISGNLDEKSYENTEDLYLNSLDVDVDYSKIVIPFSTVFKSIKSRDIYSGNEKIPFKERDQGFKMILKHEFSTLLKI
jgi:hypothetical protein